MRKTVFVSKIILIVVIMLSLIFGIIMPQYSTGYTASLGDKFDRLRSIDEPKIVLVGDSSVVFGFDSEKIQEAFNMPVVNFGFSIDLGQPFHTEMIKANINEGDIIVLAPARFNDETTAILDPILAWVSIENNFRMWSGISPENRIDMILAFPTYLRRAIALFISGEGNLPDYGPYSRAQINVYGDSKYPRPKDGDVEWQFGYGHLFDDNQISPAMKAYWNEFNEFVISRNARLFITGPPILENALSVDLMPLQTQLDEGLNFPMISNLEDYVYPFEYFFDQNFHLNDFGVEVRTDQFIQDLKFALNS